MKALYDADADLRKVAEKTIAVIGFGSQGKAQAQNLRDSGMNVVIGLREGSKSADDARKEGFEVLSPDKAAEKANFIMMLIPDEEQPAMYMKSVAPHLKAGKYLGFSHGFGIHFGTIVPPKDVNVLMIAPKGPGRLVRTEYANGRVRMRAVM